MELKIKTNDDLKIETNNDRVLYQSLPLEENSSSSFVAAKKTHSEEYSKISVMLKVLEMFI